MRTRPLLAAAALASLLACKHDAPSAPAPSGGGTAAADAPAQPSAALGALLAAVPADAFVVATVDPRRSVRELMHLFPMPADEAKALDDEVRGFLSARLGFDLTAARGIVLFVAGVPPRFAVLIGPIAGAAAGSAPGATAAPLAGADGQRVELERGVQLVRRGEVLVVGQPGGLDAALAVLDGKAPGLMKADGGLKRLLAEVGGGAWVAVAALRPAGLPLPLPPPFGELTELGVSLGSGGLRALVGGDAKALDAIQQLAQTAVDQFVGQLEREKRQALDRGTPAPEGVGLIVASHLARGAARTLAPRREGNRLVTQLSFDALGGSGMAAVSVVGALAAVAIPAFDDYMRRAKTSEAQLELQRLGQNLRVAYVERGAYPAGRADPTPGPRACCAEPGGACPPGDWSAPAWQALDFRIDAKTYFRYAYESDGATAHVVATGDPGCGGHEVTYRLDATVENGQPVVRVTGP